MPGNGSETIGGRLRRQWRFVPRANTNGAIGYSGNGRQGLPFVFSGI
jgi:hypothetical protein